jgi:hypothetical protein
MTSDNNGHDNGSRDVLGRFIPGNPGKPKGSTRNRLRDRIKSFVDENMEGLPEWFESLKPKDKIDVLLMLMPYCVSRLQSVSVSDTEGNEVDTRPMVDITKLKPETVKDLLHAVTDIETSN